MMPYYLQMQEWSVAPFAGAWIEIPLSRSVSADEYVAPFAGAWIEIDRSAPPMPSMAVAPFAGAWIEII